jgi:hypothetical protein
MSEFATFWHGPRLSAFEAACLHSFVAAGHGMTLFSYSPVEGVPAGVRSAPAEPIAEAARLGSFRVGGAASLSHFSDWFRYRLQQRTPLTWVDADMLLLRSWPQEPDQLLLARETPDMLASAVLRVPASEPWLDELVAQCEALADRPLRWGETGPRLLTRIAGARAAQAVAPALHCPVHWDDFWKPLLPEHADECRALCAQARTLHLWNNLIDGLGYWKDWLPPAGSYLHECFVACGAAPLFRGEYPLPNLRRLVENWRSRQTGRHLGLGGVLRQLLPSIARSWRFRRG